MDLNQLRRIMYFVIRRTITRLELIEYFRSGIAQMCYLYAREYFNEASIDRSPRAAVHNILTSGPNRMENRLHRGCHKLAAVAFLRMNKRQYTPGPKSVSYSAIG